MVRKYKKVETSNPILEWIKDEAVEGQILAVKSVEYKNQRGEDVVSNLYTFEREGGLICDFWGTAILDKHLLKRIGQYVLITWKGKYEKEGKQPVNLFDIAVAE